MRKLIFCRINYPGRWFPFSALLLIAAAAGPSLLPASDSCSCKLSRTDSPVARIDESRDFDRNRDRVRAFEQSARLQKAEQERDEKRKQEAAFRLANRRQHVRYYSGRRR